MFESDGEGKEIFVEIDLVLRGCNLVWMEAGLKIERVVLLGCSNRRAGSLESAQEQEGRLKNWRDSKGAARRRSRKNGSDPGADMTKPEVAAWFSRWRISKDCC